MTVKMLVLPKPRPEQIIATRGGGILADFAEASDDFDNYEPEVVQPQVFDVSEKEAEDLKRDPNNLAAPQMDLKLIEPVSDAEAAEVPDAWVETADASKAAWGIEAIGATKTKWDGAGVKVAVLDTGIDADHPAFEGVNIKHKNFTDQSMASASGHGTHCAGTIFGRDVDGVRIGVARGVTEALDAKVLPGTTDDLAKALHWAFEEEKAHVISMSLRFDFYKMFRHERDGKGLNEEDAFSKTQQEYRANIAMFDALFETYRLRALKRQGALFIAATGNESKRDSSGYTIAAAAPAGAKNVLAVGALGRSADGLVAANFSNTKPQIAAPGVQVLSAKKGARTPGSLLKSSDGTSMACPHVAGLAALYWQEALADPYASANPELLRAMIIGRADRTKLVTKTTVDVGNGLPVPPRLA